ncbi:MAG: ABC transporter permease subunit [Deltaproteobacteria bacterium]|nr:ABC transporter permease subunit [Deltaproteobacteria bacterium]
MNNNRVPAGVPDKRDKKTRKIVLIADRIADRVITTGGILVIAAVLCILVFLLVKVVPLFKSGSIDKTYSYTIEKQSDDLLFMGIDDYKTISVLMKKNGEISMFHAKSGFRLKSPEVTFDEKEITAFSKATNGEHLAFGLSDGSVRLARTLFDINIITEKNIPKNLETLDDRDSTDGDFVYSRIPGGQYRKVGFKIELEAPIKVSPENRPVIAVDYHITGEAERRVKALVTIDAGGSALLSKVKSKINLLTGERRAKIKKTILPALPQNLGIHSVLLTEQADMVLISAAGGRVYRYNTEDFNSPILAEIFHLLPDKVEFTVFDSLPGGQSIVAGGSDGSLGIYFIINRPERGTADGKAIIKARTLKEKGEPVVMLAASGRGKSFAAACKSGATEILHATSQKIIWRFHGYKNGQLAGILLAPKLDGLLSISKNGQVRLTEFTVAHPETTFSTLFRKIWYEGYTEPTYTWQSSAGTDDFEQKFSLIPLIFGSVKAAFYSLLFAIPIAILGAIYTSEFLGKRTRDIIKPGMEMMASLPSVILGFVAALVLAPVVEKNLLAIILSVLIIPAFLMLSALLWQLIPLHMATRWQGGLKFTLLIIAITVGLTVSAGLGPVAEKIMFHGDFKAWLNFDVSGAEPFLFLLALPVSFLAAAVLLSKLAGRYIAEFYGRISVVNAAIFDLARWFCISIIAIILSFAIAKIAALLGLDARNSIIGAYAQRNTLIIGFAMGFAVIPIIYTLADDALTSVPSHLRAASLACGATPWQTALYVVLPTALSGVFSAIMIGMGRAVGETMIVVMAAGNTPIIDMNIFNGLRALSATIAVELPEAVKDGTLYRVLFLAALVLFAMTFVINTVAEIVRIRFRKKTLQL